MVGSALDITCALVLNTHYQSSEKIQDSFAQVFMNVDFEEKSREEQKEYQLFQ